MTSSFKGIKPVVGASSNPSYYGNENPNYHLNCFNEELQQRLKDLKMAERKLEKMRGSADLTELYQSQRNNNPIRFPR